MQPKRDIRVLITGSRTWTDRVVIERALKPYRAWQSTTLVSGHCPTGADALAEEVAQEFGFELELHPADWRAFGKRAGFIRNTEMVRLGANICHAFIRWQSAGATHCAKEAQRYGIPLRVWRME